MFMPVLGLLCLCSSTKFQNGTSVLLHILYFHVTHGNFACQSNMDFELFTFPNDYE